MATITEDYVSFETARLLKEKGFHEDCKCQYGKGGSISWTSCNNGNVTTFARPTIQMTMKWLSEKHNLFIQITVDFSDGAYPMYDVCVVDLARCNSIIVNGYNRYSCEEAIEAGIKHCLENLI
jgi:hypothetical protein